MDSPIVPPDMMMLTWTAVNRVTRSGQVLGPDERATPYAALNAITASAAYQYFEKKTKGTLEAGKNADLVILDGNPLKVDPATIKDIRVVETIKDGKTVFTRVADAKQAAAWSPGMYHDHRESHGVSSIGMLARERAALDRLGAYAAAR